MAVWMAWVLLGAPAPPAIAIDGWVLGFRRPSGWVRAAPEDATRLDPAAFRPLSNGKLGDPVRAAWRGDPITEGLYLQGPKTDKGVLVYGLKPTVPRQPVNLPNPGRLYDPIVAKFFAAQGLPSAKVLRAIRGDLDGDGTDEVLLEARSRPTMDGVTSGNWKPQDASLVLLRCLRGGKVVQIPLEFASVKKHGIVDQREVRAVADFDGDGRMEVLVGWRGYEWHGGSLWGYRAGKPKLLLRNGAGV